MWDSPEILGKPDYADRARMALKAVGLSHRVAHFPRKCREGMPTRGDCPGFGCPPFRCPGR